MILKSAYKSDKIHIVMFLRINKKNDRSSDILMKINVMYGGTV